MPETLVSNSYEPLQHASLRVLSVKTAMLLALTSAAKVGELTALSFNPCFLLLTGDCSGAVL